MAGRLASSVTLSKCFLVITDLRQSLLRVRCGDIYYTPSFLSRTCDPAHREPYVLFLLVGQKPPPTTAYIKGRTLNFLCININSCLDLIPQPRTLCAPVLHLRDLASSSSLVYLEPRWASFYILKVHFKRAFSILIWGSHTLSGFRERCPPDLLKRSHRHTLECK